MLTIKNRSIKLSLGKDYKLSPCVLFCADRSLLETTSYNIHKPGSQTLMTLENAWLVYKVKKQNKTKQNIPNILISAYEFSQSREFDKRSKHFPESVIILLNLITFSSFYVLIMLGEINFALLGLHARAKIQMYFLYTAHHLAHKSFLQHHHEHATLQMLVYLHH